MSDYTNMLARTVYLAPQPGEIWPVLRLKQNTTSTRLKLQIPPGDIITDYYGKHCVIKATLPDGKAFFYRSGCGYENLRINVNIDPSGVKEMTSVVGRYKCTATILDLGEDTSTTVTRNTYMKFDMLTVLPFTVIVEERA